MDKRKALLAVVHIAKKQLGLSDDAYRKILMELFGVNSAALLDISQLVSLVRHFEDMGFKTKRRVERGREALIKKIFAICYDLDLPVPQYANAIARRMFGIDRIDWCDEDKLMKVVAALNYYKKKKEEKENGV